MISRIFVTSIGIALAAGVLVTFYAPNIGFQARVTNGCDRPSGYTLLIADENGYNNSKHHSTPWPLIQVHRGDTVRIIVCNLDSVFPHGFGIDNYVDPVQLRPGESFSTSFVAQNPGNYSVYCSIFCPVHQYMLNGLLVVQS